MTIEMIPLRKLKPSDNNPRKTLDDETITGLAESIKTDGLLQNLIAAKPQGRKRIYHIICGERRYRALCQLVEQGDLPTDLTVPVDVRSDLDAREVVRIATVENIQRADLSPLEEAHAISVLSGTGGDIEEIAAQTGLSISTIKRRIALLDLTDAAKEALVSDDISLAQAEALSLGTHQQQEDLLPRVVDGWYATKGDIKERMIGDAVSVSDAIFDVQAYTGTFTTDLFGEAETTYFDDVEQFYDLQKQAAADRVAELEQTMDWVDFIEGRHSSLHYREADEGEASGAVVCLTPEGRVEIHDSLVRSNVDASVDRHSEPKAKATYAKPVRHYLAMQKSGAVQLEMLNSPRLAKTVLVAHLLWSVRVHECVPYLTRLEESDHYKEAMSREAANLLDVFGLEVTDHPLDELLWLARSHKTAYRLVKTLDDEGLDRLMVFLSAIRFGQTDCEALDVDADSIFNTVAADLDVDMCKHWTPGLWFLGRRSTEQLKAILKASGMTRLFGSGKGYKKSELVSAMAAYFAKVKGLNTCQPDQAQARDWLPEAMAFPTIDPDTDVLESTQDSASQAV